MNDELKQQMRDELKQTKNELIKDIQELLNSFVKNSNSNNNVKDKIDEWYILYWYTSTYKET